MATLAKCLTTVVFAVAVALLSDEAKGWLHWLPRKIKSIAVNRLPEHYRARYGEEWESDLNQIPGRLSKLIYSIGFLRSAVRIRDAAIAGQISRIEYALRRTCDVLIASLVLLAEGPLMLFICFLIRIESPGPSVLKVEHRADDGTLFRIYRFRCLRLDNTIISDPSNIGFLASNVRITRTGKMLRRTGLHWLPSLLSVIQGDMTMFGSRPGMPPSFTRSFRS